MSYSPGYPPSGLFYVLAQAIEYMDTGSLIFLGISGLILSLLVCLFGLRLYLFLVWLSGAVLGGIVGALIVVETDLMYELGDGAIALGGILGLILGGGLALAAFWFSIWLIGFMLTGGLALLLTGTFHDGFEGLWASHGIAGIAGSVLILKVVEIVFYFLSEILRAIDLSTRGNTATLLIFATVIGVIGGFIFTRFFELLGRFVSAIIGAFGVACSVVLMFALEFHDPYQAMLDLANGPPTEGWTVVSIIMIIAVTMVMGIIGIRVQLGMKVDLPKTGRLSQATGTPGAGGIEQDSRGNQHPPQQNPPN